MSETKSHDPYANPYTKVERELDAIGNEKSRYKFTFDPWLNLKGRWLQYFAKIFITEGINRLHRQTLRKYDEKAFVCHDPRLFERKENIRATITECIGEERVRDILFKALDIFFFYLKEDVRYRCLFSEMENRYKERFTEPFVLDVIEKEHWRDWRGK